MQVTYIITVICDPYIAVENSSQASSIVCNGLPRVPVDPSKAKPGGDAWCSLGSPGEHLQSSQPRQRRVERGRAGLSVQRRSWHPQLEVANAVRRSAHHTDGSGHRRPRSAVSGRG